MRLARPWCLPVRSFNKHTSDSRNIPFVKPEGSIDGMLYIIKPIIHQ